MTEFIEYAMPYRWKIFQVLPITGQNNLKENNLEVTINEFDEFVKKHKLIIKNVVIVPENNDQMKGSYAMIDPAGRFFNNSSGTHIYSKPILNIGCASAISEMNYNFDKFEERGGLYNWTNPFDKSA
jgi:radical S-adenosyl methionine domain-containing protein 2